MISQKEIEHIVRKLQAGEELPSEYKAKLFPSKQKEYELSYSGKMRKEDLLANEDGSFPVPLQSEKIFNGDEYIEIQDGWKNMIVFGDNLQLLKTIHENSDPMIKDKVKGKVKLIYIDPPFATASDFGATKGQKAYTDKTKGAEFVEFIRKRLILAREILADDGCIYVHLDGKKGHYIKVILDEVFGESNFMNELIWLYSGREMTYTYWNSKHQNIFLYAKKRANMYFDWEAVGLEPSKEVQEQYKHVDDEGKRYVIRNSKGSKGLSVEGPDTYRQYYKPVPPRDWFEIPIVSSGDENVDYPTQKPEKLLEKIIRASSKKGDIVLDFFGGSGATMAVAEKLGRRWITCDLGKLSFYTMQKRILKIQESQDLVNPKKKYNQKAKSFITAQLGIYDLQKALDLEWEKYLKFVCGLFEIEGKKNSVSGFEFEGKKNGSPVKIFDFRKFKNSSIDEKYILEIHKIIKNKMSDKVYIIAPANYVDFLSDYHEIDSIRYYFLKIPYHVIKELHKTPFQKLKQPQSKKNVNDLEEAIGFHFIRSPEVKSSISEIDDHIKLSIKSFVSTELDSDKEKVEKDLKNFETLSAVFIDTNYDGKAFQMDKSFFADELLPNKKSQSEMDENEIRAELKVVKDTGLQILLNKSEVGKQIMAIYTDIYGNDFSEVFNI